MPRETRVKFLDKKKNQKIFNCNDAHRVTENKNVKEHDHLSVIANRTEFCVQNLREIGFFFLFRKLYKTIVQSTCFIENKHMSFLIVTFQIL